MAEDSTITSTSQGQGTEHRRADVVPQLILITLSDEPSTVSSRHSLATIDEVRFGRGPREATRRTLDGLRILELRVPDPRMSGEHGRLFRGPAGWVLDDPGSKNGVIVDGELTRRAVLADGALIELGHTFFWFASEVDGAPADERADELRPPSPALATFDRELAEQFDALSRVATTGVSVVLLGETGTGKEVVARALHELSGRRGAFVAVNCGALPDTLVEAQLFGHRKGAFSGATGDRPGLVRSADHGTLFLDEVGELPAASQTAFLRVLQEREVVPIGDDRPIKIDVQLCAATLQDLEAMIAAGRFRSDLYARLVGLDVELPPLRKRRVDLGILIASLLARIPGGDRARFTPAAMRALLHHDWPLNIRELEKTLQRAVALSADGLVELPHLPGDVTRPRDRGEQSPSARPPSSPSPPPALDEEDRVLRERLIELLTRHHGNVRAVAAELRKQRTQVYRWAERLAIDLGAFRK